uniref:Anthranilate phosphoribosyltransferase n=1 Tax=uncultured marine thaumarchaeote KM3_193_D11 TaxID=1456082 RepID=A0A075GWA9_9ARCH|nr:anthranilate phosphoribosyltransferase (trpD) [uncultured marine thaumarchaeote KM3_193_D11]
MKKINGDLTFDEMSSEMSDILNGKNNDGEIAEFLRRLSEKGETDEELRAMLTKMNEHSVRISPRCHGSLIDVCGTGGDNLQTFNISTAASFVIAGAGGNVAKHGNRSVSGISGSADIFEYFGFNLQSETRVAEEMIEKLGIGFMFAPTFHPAMKNVALARKILGKRTAFNLLGPLCNPANVKHQLIGVFADDYIKRIVMIMQKNHSETILAVRSEDGMDELSTTSKNKVCMLKNNEISEFIINPEEYNMEKGNLSDIQISTKQNAIDAFVNVLNNTSNKTMKEITILNAAGGMIVGGLCDEFKDGVELATETINNGKAFEKLKQFAKENNAQEKLEGIK